MAGKTGLHRDARGLEVTNLADEHDVRVLTKNGAQRSRERETLRVDHLNLGNAGDLVLHRVFDRDDVDLAGGGRRKTRASSVAIALSVVQPAATTLDHRPAGGCDFRKSSWA